MATSTMKKSLEIRTITVQGTTNLSGAIPVQGTGGVSADDQILSVACTSDANTMCIPWKYDGSIWYVKCLSWESMASRNNTSVTLVVKYIPNGYL